MLSQVNGRQSPGFELARISDMLGALVFGVSADHPAIIAWNSTMRQKSRIAMQMTLPEAHTEIEVQSGLVTPRPA